MAKKKKVETIEEKWQWTCYTYDGDVFDTPEHQAALSKMKSIDERLAYKERIMAERERELFGHN